MRTRILETGIKKAEYHLRMGAKKATNFKLVFNEIGLDMLEIEKSIFSSRGHRGGGSWAALKPDTVRKKGNTQLLYTTGAKPGYSKNGNNALYSSVSELDAPGQIFQTYKHSLHFGTSLPEGWTMQQGAPAKNIRARPFLKFTERDTIKWERMILDHLMEPFVADQ